MRSRGTYTSTQTVWLRCVAPMRFFASGRLNTSGLPGATGIRASGYQPLPREVFW